jgi:integrase
MAINLNSDVVYRSAKPQDKDYTINDGGGLVLLVKTTGTKLWRFIYRFEGKQNRLSFGAYPDSTLVFARSKSVEAREKISGGIDPGAIKKEAKAAKRQESDNKKRVDAGLPVVGSFADTANQWLDYLSKHPSKRTGKVIAPLTLEKKAARIKTYVLPALGGMPLKEIKPSNVWDVIKTLIDKKQIETAHRVFAEIVAIFNHAIIEEETDYNPALPVAARVPAPDVKHRAALTDPNQVAQLLRDISNYQGTFIVQCAFRLSPLLFQRPGEIRQMLWADVDLVAQEWRPHVSKTDFHHIVPLSTQAVAILLAIQPLTGCGQYVFASRRGDGRPMSSGTIITALKSLGYDSDVMTAHGFRTTASTLLNEQGWSPDAIERQLSHMPKDQIRAAYNRAQYLEERRRMMQSWANYLDGLKAGAKVIAFKQAV